MKSDVDNYVSQDDVCLVQLLSAENLKSNKAGDCLCSLIILDECLHLVGNKSDSESISYYCLLSTGEKNED